MGKVFVEVHAIYDRNGTMTPTSIKWEDDRIFIIDKILDTRRAASLKAGGQGIRYTCRIQNKQTYLFFEEHRWFVEGK